MSLGWRFLSSLPRLNSYEQALAHEQNVKPIRRDKENPKPLGARSHKYVRIAKEGDEVVVYASNRRLMPFMPDNTLRLHFENVWSDAAAREIVEGVTGVRTETIQGRIWVYRGGDYYALRTPGKAVFDFTKRLWVSQPPPTTNNIFARCPSNIRWVYTNPEEVVKRTVNRKAMNAVRKSYAPAISYIDALNKIRGEGSIDGVAEIIEVLTPLVSFEDAVYSLQTIHYQYGINPVKVINAALGTPSAHTPAAARFCGLLSSEDPADHYRAYVWARGSITEVQRAITMHHQYEVLNHTPMVAIPNRNTIRNNYDWVTTAPPERSTNIKTKEDWATWAINAGIPDDVASWVRSLPPE